MEDTCEVCGREVFQHQITPDGDLTGPFYERRSHLRSGVRHTWHQPHNCVHPQPDDCQFCRRR